MFTRPIPASGYYVFSADGMRKISSPDHRLKRGQGINDDIFSDEKKITDNIEKKTIHCRPFLVVLF